jgi:hypothetical protein
MNKTKTASTNPQARLDGDLDSRYGAIGIPAVAAALQFKSEVKNPAYAPCTPQSHDERIEDMAA